MDQTSNPNAEGTRSIENSANRKGRRNSVPKLWLVMAGLAVLMVLAFQVNEQVHQKSLRILQAQRLKNIGLAVRVYTADHGTPPDSLAVLTNEIADAIALIDPISAEPFMIVGGTETPAQGVMAFSPWIEGQGGACVMGDGSVHSFAPEQYKAMIQPYLRTNVTIQKGQR